VRPLEIMTEIPAQRNCNLHRPELWLNSRNHLKHWVKGMDLELSHTVCSHCNC
jgi:hypothetical protein